MAPQSSEQQSWPVQVFRHSVGRGWETVDNAGDIDSDDPVMATPRARGIEIRKFRVRIHLFSQKNDDGSKNRSYGYVSRRVDRIYCPSRSSAGALVLKFRNKQECIEFFDRLVALNPTGSNRIGEESTVASSSDKDDAGDVENRKRHGLDLAKYGDDVSVKRRKADTMSYIVRLLHEQDFQTFVNDIEQTLLSSNDGASILAALKRPPPPLSSVQAQQHAFDKSNDDK